jgi:hypothetical protein
VQGENAVDAEDLFADIDRVKGMARAVQEVDHRPFAVDHDLDEGIVAQLVECGQGKAFADERGHALRGRTGRDHTGQGHGFSSLE